jgi:Ca2+-binding EF-hand superfamily protein
MHNDSDIMNNSLGQNFKKEVGEKYEKLSNLFRRIDKNSDDMIDQQELLEFLDSNMANGNKFDRKTFKQMFSLMDPDNSGTISMYSIF